MTSLTATRNCLKNKYILPRLWVLIWPLLGALACPVSGQTYQVEPAAPQKSAAPAAPANRTSPPNASQQQQLGWGSNIQDARLARAAELALKQGKRAQALEFAQRAAQAAPNDAQLWILLGYAARLNGQYALSAEAYNHGLRLKPGALDGMSGLAQTFSAMGKTDEAERLLKQVIAADPRRTDDGLLLGELLMRSGDYTGALEYFRKAEQAQPSTRAEVLTALSYQHLKQFDLANRYLEMARRRAPDNPEVQRSLAGYYLETANYAEAIAALKAIHNPRPDVLAELAYIYQLDGKLTEAAKLYAQAANALPKDLGLQLSAAQAQVANASLDGANRFLERAQHLDPEYYRLHAIRGEIARLLDKSPDAIREYTQVVAHLPASPSEGPLFGIQMHMDLMQLYQSVKQGDAAREQLNVAQQQISTLNEQGPGRVPFLRLRAAIKMQLSDLDGAAGDLNEALTINPRDSGALQLDGDLLVKQGHPADAIEVYSRILTTDPKNRYALTSLGYASRAAGRDLDAEKYFRRLQDNYPALYVPYVALGDLYTARHDFTKAEADYVKAYRLAPTNALIVAGAMNAAIEAHTLDLAGVWSGRATPEMQQEPQLLREEERYLRLKGSFKESAAIGEQVIKLMPKDRDVAVYLGYDYLGLERYDELLALTRQYEPVFPKDADLPLLAGYVHKHAGDLDEARGDFGRALERDPNIVTAYVNRGYVLNDLQQPKLAAADFEAALKREPGNGEAHLGLAYSELDIKRPQLALKQSQLAEQSLGDSQAVHLIRATAYGQKSLLTKAASEYRLALKFTPNDGALHLALAGALYSARHYHEAISELEIAQKLTPTDAATFALLARAHAQLGDREETLRYVQLAEQNAATSKVNPKKPGSGPSGILLSTGSALAVLGDQSAAMERYRRALTAPQSDRVGVRLAIAQLFAQQGHAEDSGRQIALGLMEAQAGETEPATGEQLVEAANVFRGLHDYELSQSYLDRAAAAGASDSAVRIGRADNYIALGDTARAQGQLAGISRDADSDPDYQYLLAEANVYRQQHHNTQALTAFAQAADAAGEDQTVEQSLLLAGGDEGLRINPRLSLLSDFSVDPIYEDTTVYVLDSKLDALAPVPMTDTALLPPPRSSLQTQWTSAYHLHLDHVPTVSGFFQLRNARGQISVPSTSSIANRDTTDYSFNVGLNPTLRLGNNAVTFNSGIQATARRDARSPVALNQNLFRIFTYAQTSSFFNAVSVSGYVLRESGPFTETNVHSRTLAGAIDFRVGQPWGKNALVTGWAASDQQFTPVSIHNYYTSSYIGWQRRFSNRLNARAVIEDLRAFRTVDTRSGIAQAVRPAGTVDFAPARNWKLQASGAYNSTRGFHVYDAVQSGFAVSYAMPFRRGFKDENGEVPLQYPIRFTGGVQQESFFNFSGPHSQQLRPYFSISLF